MTKWESLQLYVDKVVSEAIKNPSEENIEFAKLTQREFESWKEKHTISDCM